ncbi:acyl-CoA dehydrogenase family protein [Paraburkholderia hospita]|jgi:alkylation response protein AidB-like acyl-CoA dehydrogenase|uniref:Acyl-CoA dehydrogenase n=1 Tax=Paraburkholderia hospita TaxID=169430 RepID=A0AAN1MP15_9BURK|nr:acyl-CoA dehydrogenase family protein [Paraburkholderia hospita]AUT74245.1 acyl-CoA dehydrogenase [Paraburkholderia hospita]EIN01213.1 putative acyl-CoA dehydrogenase [Paraburkholderia hospita]OUL79763.1 acyl-CoA dehydrogenase [Paraburkholderia hospita]OUL84508.1 acyl-CoA dehydrogenase [Paraburkholderia hospita]SEH58906.1 Acyl-CoA dehydrogenase [Paraburkholderia hospita]
MSSIDSIESQSHSDSLQGELARWLDANAEALDIEQSRAGEVLPRLARAGIFGIGVPLALGGGGGSIADAIGAVAQVAQRSVTAAFVLWGHRTFIEYLLNSPNTTLRDRWLPALLTGEIAGATGLSNAMKFLSNIESLQMHAVRQASGWTLNGSLPWITNLRREGFLAAAAFDHAGAASPSIFAIPNDTDGAHRSDDLDLIGLRASNTAALTLKDVVLDEQYQISADAPAFLARVRPAFLGLQCGLSLGLARRALAAVAEAGDGTRAAIRSEAARVEARLDAETAQLLTGVSDGSFLQRPASLFELRISLAQTVSAAVGLEVQAAGGRGYLRQQAGTARRVREASFIPIVTPSLVQLKSQLALHERTDAQ